MRDKKYVQIAKCPSKSSDSMYNDDTKYIIDRHIYYVLYDILSYQFSFWHSGQQTRVEAFMIESASWQILLPNKIGQMILFAHLSMRKEWKETQ